MGLRFLIEELALLRLWMGFSIVAVTMLDEFDPIGERLVAARKAGGLSLDDVVFQTQLPKSVIISLEAGDFSAFASPLYAKSFLAQYSDYLNVDVQLWLNVLEPETYLNQGVLKIVEPPEKQEKEKAPRVEKRGGVLSIIGLFALSGGLVYAAIKGYDFFESRFGSEGHAHSNETKGVVPNPAPMTTRSSAAPAQPPQTPSIVKEDEDLAKPPPRAIIVR
ncbi:MAG: helix-turn-helix domain-containing protein [Gloeobacteraceae cyanobacterium ES-bin-144]|nr:helix-turn-helix domain-containing protein [Verrucomicrobiales bacterium]